MSKHDGLAVLGLALTLSLSVAAQEKSDPLDPLEDEDIATLDYPQSQGVRGEGYSFAKSKYQLAKQVYHDHPLDFYGGCQYQTTGNLLTPVWSSCGFKPRKNPERAKRIEWEHIVPAWTFGHQLQCWQQGGRAQCRNTQQKFRQMEADMHNLVPAIGEINGDRSNFAFGVIEGEPRPYGKPNMEIDFTARLAEPPDHQRGDIARTYLYMQERYGFKLSRAEESLMMAWNNLDPVDAWEKTRHERITRIQGNDNPFITQYRSLQRPSTTPENNPVSVPPIAAKDWFESLYQWVNAHQNTLPYPVVLVMMALYAWFRHSSSRAKPKTTSRRSSRTKSP